jgi:MFS family permease
LTDNNTSKDTGTEENKPSNTTDEKFPSNAALKIKEFRNYTLARSLITIAAQMQAVIVGWQVYELTKDPFSLGLIGLAEAIPSILVSLYAGNITDLHDRKKILQSAFSLMLFCSFSLFLISTQSISFLETNMVVSIYSVIFISGIARGFSGPAAFAFMPQLVPKKILPNAITWNTSAWQIGAVTGPALGGFAYGFFGVKFSYLSVVMITVIPLLLLTTIKNKPVPVAAEIQNLKERLTAGLKFVFRNKIILGALSLDMFAVLFGGAVALLTIFAADIFFVGPEGLGVLRASPSFGAVAMGLLMTRFSPNARAGRNMLVSVAGFGISILIFAISKNFYLSIFALVMSGGFDIVSVIIRANIVQLMTPDNMKGRVSAVNLIFIGSSNEIGAFESGLAAKIIGVSPSVIFGGGMTLLIAGIVSIASPKLRKLKL